MTAIEWITDMCSGSPTSGVSAIERPRLATPFRATVDGQCYAAGTDGYRLVAVPGELAPERADAPQVDWLFLAASSRARATMRIAAMLKWARHGVCRRCHGTGRHQCCGAFEHACSACATKRRHEEAHLDGLIGPARINRAYLASILRGAPGESVDVSTHGPMDPVMFYGDEWIGALIPRRGNGETCPVFAMDAGFSRVLP